MNQDNQVVSQTGQATSLDYYQQWSHPPSPTISRRTNYSWKRSLSQHLTIKRHPPKMVVCRVVLLDQEHFQVEFPKNATGQYVYDNVKQKLNLEEADYFGLSYRNSQNLRFWLNLDKRIDKQVESIKDIVFYWEVKFYPPAPEQLNEDLTRYLVVLQIRQDLFTGRLPASFQTLAILGSFTAQGEIGDFDRSQHVSIDYLRPYSFAPQQSEELLLRICDLHKTCKGLTPAEADLYFLDNAKKCAMYGMDMYPVKDSSGREVRIGVSACGLYVYHGRLRIECFKWPRILKMEYKRNVFRVKVRPAEFEHYQQSLGYQLPSVKLAKRLMRIAVENHQFFRLKQPELTDTSTLRGFGSRRWRMSGRTQAQLRNVGTPRKSFSRSNSIMSSETYPLHQSTSTMPVPASRRINREPDLNRNYNTLGGHMNGGTDKLVDISHDDNGEYVLGDSLNTTSKSRDSDPRRRLPNADSHTHDNLVNGEHAPELESDVLPNQSTSSARTPDRVYRKPVPQQRSASEADNGDGSSQPMVVESAVTPVESTPLQLSTMDSQPDTSELKKGASPPPAASARHPSTGSRSPSTSAQSPSNRIPPSVGKFGVGDLPMPSFSLESVGVMPTGGIDHSVKLQTAERAEKVIKTGVFTTERGGHIETKVKHTITICGETDIDDQLLLDAIQTVTGLDNTLGVDKIEIKTESESP